jgi:lambda repressor-like predicted transcriptional regulator
MNKAEKIIQTIQEKGLTVNKVERTAGVEKGTLRRWAKTPPKTMEMEDSINKAIEELHENR